MPPPMQKPFTIAVVGNGRSCSFWNVSQPRRVNEMASSADLKLANSWMSAPAMKLSLAERMISPFGFCFFTSSRSSESSSSASRENVFADSPCLSNVSQASPCRSVSQRQCFAIALLSARSILPPLNRFDQHRAAEPPADADRGDAFFLAVFFKSFQQVKDDARARGADRMAQRDGATIDVELRFI